MVTLSKQDLINELRKMQVTQDVKGVVKEKPLLIEAAESIPLLNKFLTNLDAAGESLGNVGEFQKGINVSAKAAKEIANGFHFGQVVVAGIDFITIPLIYLMAFLTNKKVPISLNKNMKWFYSAVILTLVLIAFFVPVTAPALAIATAGLILASSVFILGKTLLEPLLTKRNIAKVTHELEAMQKEALDLEKEFNEPFVTNETKLKFVDLTARHARAIEKLQHLKNKESSSQHKFKEAPVTRVLDKGVMVAVSAIAVIGAILSLIFPPLGLTILGISAAITAIYFLGRVATHLALKFGPGLIQRMKAEPLENKPEESLAVETPIPVHAHESTLDASINLGRNLDNTINGLKKAAHLPIDDEDEQTKPPITPAELIISVLKKEPVDDEDGDGEKVRKVP